MKLIKNILMLAPLLCILVISLLLVMLNSESVQLDILGLFFVQQSLGLLLVFAFVLGVLFTLSLTFIPHLILDLRNKQLQKKLQN